MRDQDSLDSGDAGGAIVIGGDYRGLTVVRSLGRHGLRVCVLTDEQIVAKTSRYASSAARWPRVDERQQVAFLLDLAAAHGFKGWILFPTDDCHARLIARHRATLGSAFRFATSSDDVVETAYDKRRTYALAAQLGVDYPHTFCAANRGELASLECLFPVILKPAFKDAFNEFTLAKAWRIADRDELLVRYDQAASMVEPASVMVQELIPGDGKCQFSFGALCDNGHVLVSVTARRTRQYPTDFGRSSCFVETIDDPEVERLATRLLKALSFTGLVEIEFKRDPRDGHYKLLDFNPRIWGWHSIGRCANGDFPWLYWQLCCHCEIAEARVPSGLRWIRMVTDLPAATNLFMNSQLSLQSYLASIHGPLEKAVFAKDDPLPVLMEMPLLAAAKAAMWLKARASSQSIQVTQRGTLWRHVPHFAIGTRRHR